MGIPKTYLTLFFSIFLSCNNNHQIANKQNSAFSSDYKINFNISFISALYLETESIDLMEAYGTITSGTCGTFTNVLFSITTEASNFVLTYKNKCIDPNAKVILDKAVIKNSSSTSEVAADGKVISCLKDLFCKLGLGNESEYTLIIASDQKKVLETEIHRTSQKTEGKETCNVFNGDTKNSLPIPGPNVIFPPVTQTKLTYKYPTSIQVSVGQKDSKREIILLTHFTTHATQAKDKWYPHSYYKYGEYIMYILPEPITIGAAEQHCIMFRKNAETCLWNGAGWVGYATVNERCIYEISVLSYLDYTDTYPICGNSGHNGQVEFDNICKKPEG